MYVDCGLLADNKNARILFENLKSSWSSSLKIHFSEASLAHPLPYCNYWVRLNMKNYADREGWSFYDDYSMWLNII